MFCGSKFSVSMMSSLPFNFSALVYHNNHFEFYLIWIHLFWSDYISHKLLIELDIELQNKS